MLDNSYVKLCCNTKHYTIAVLNDDKFILINNGNNKKIIYLDQFKIKNAKITDIHMINSSLFLLYSNGSLYEYTTFYDQFELINCTHNTNIVSLYCGKEIMDINDGYNFCNIFNTEDDMDKNYIAIENIKITRKNWKPKNHYKFPQKFRINIYYIYLILFVHNIKIPICLFKYIVNNYILNLQ
jgi:hypothetical protein